jgi:PsbP
VLLVAAAVWFVVRPKGEAADRAGSAPSSTTSTSIPAPSGFKGYQENGFSIVVPDDWFRDSYEDEVMWTSDSNPEDSLIIHVVWWDEREGNAMSRLTEYEDTELKLLDIYTEVKRLRLEETAAPPGMTGAELEVTYHVTLPEGQLDVHEVMHAVVTDKGKTYLLTLAAQNVDPAATEKLWQDNQSALTTALESFRVTG